MIAYLDSSVVVRVVLKQTPRLTEWHDITVGVSSAIAGVECGRAIDRHARAGGLGVETGRNAGIAIREILARIDLAAVDDVVLTRAAGSFPILLRSLDAIHLATALMYRDAQPDDEPPIRFATHDIRLATAARALGFDVIGT